jgi:CheY-like chemotaxis protein
MNNHTILIVEDENDARELLAEILRYKGFETATAANGAEAWKYLHDSDPPCLILLDITMPVMDGREFRALQLADRKLSEIPTVLLSALGPSFTHELRPTKVITKPVDFDALTQLIGAHCDRHHH